MRPQRRRAVLINDGLAPGSSVLDAVAESHLFAQGQIAITWSDFTAVPTYEEAEIDFGMTPFFVVEGQEDFVDKWTAPWGTFTERPHAADALLFVEFMVTDAQEIKMEVAPDPPLSTVVAEEANYGGDDPIKHQYMRTIPKDEAARIDGAGSGRSTGRSSCRSAFRRSWWSGSSPSWGSGTTLSGRSSTSTIRTVHGPTRACARQRRSATEWNIVMAATLMAMLPPLIVYAFRQNKLMGGIAAVGIRG